MLFENLTFRFFILFTKTVFFIRCANQSYTLRKKQKFSCFLYFPRILGISFVPTKVVFSSRVVSHAGFTLTCKIHDELRSYVRSTDHQANIPLGGARRRPLVLKNKSHDWSRFNAPLYKPASNEK